MHRIFNKVFDQAKRIKPCCCVSSPALESGDLEEDEGADSGGNEAPASLTLFLSPEQAEFL